MRQTPNNKSYTPKDGVIGSELPIQDNAFVNVIIDKIIVNNFL